LHDIAIPSSTECIDGSAFITLCLESLSIAPGKSAFAVRLSFLEDVSGREIVRYFGDSTSATIPEGIRSSVNRAFLLAGRLKN
jgi:hypothetical protein